MVINGWCQPERHTPLRNQILIKSETTKVRTCCSAGAVIPDGLL